MDLELNLSMNNTTDINLLVENYLHYGLINISLFQESIKDNNAIKLDSYNIKLRQKVNNLDPNFDWKSFDSKLNDSISTLKSKTKNITSIEKILDITVVGFKSLKNEFNSIFGNTISSIVLLLIVIIINTFIISLIMIIGLVFGLTPALMMLIGVTIVAPLVEETAKYISIRGGATKEYFIIFNVYEFLSYTTRMIFSGFNIIPTILIRLAAILMHGTTTTIQSTFNNLFPNDHSKRMIGLSIAIILHALWNFFGTIFEKDIMIFSGLND